MSNPDPEVTSIDDDWELVTYEEPYAPATDPAMLVRVTVSLP